MSKMPLSEPLPEEFDNLEIRLEEAKDLPTETIKRILSGHENMDFYTEKDLLEVLLRRSKEGESSDSDNFQFYLWLLTALVLLTVLAFFGWKLYKSLKERERKREEKKKLKMKKKK